MAILNLLHRGHFT